eukprot:TRINITY_DN10367_c0_g1_i1.p1 TRINITY_DN10367_c0_g1~~TRINITY_DN10367_c0_g1_i1.p1  ORF type:complete len:709 (+),score=126.73 TRINITY_DN10367_c0_g1_i1:96-2222(+)
MCIRDSNAEYGELTALAMCGDQPARRRALTQGVGGAPEQPTQKRRLSLNIGDGATVSVTLLAENFKKVILPGSSGASWAVGETIGKSNTAKVKAARNAATLDEVAIKCMKRKTVVEASIVKEVGLMKQLDHPHILRFIDYMVDERKHYIVMELAPGGDLFDLVVAKGSLAEDEAQHYTRQILHGLEHMHSVGIVHRDLKPENILLGADHSIKIADFGLSAQFRSGGQSVSLSTPCGTRKYCAPEMFANDSYTAEPIDVWSTGVILFVLTQGEFPFEQATFQCARYVSVFQDDWGDFFEDLATEISAELQDLIRRMLDPDSIERITIPKMQAHPWIVTDTHRHSKPVHALEMPPLSPGDSLGSLLLSEPSRADSLFYMSGSALSASLDDMSEPFIHDFAEPAPNQGFDVGELSRLFDFAQENMSPEEPSPTATQVQNGDGLDIPKKQTPPRTPKYASVVHTVPPKPPATLPVKSAETPDSLPVLTPPRVKVLSTESDMQGPKTPSAERLSPQGTPPLMPAGPTTPPATARVTPPSKLASSGDRIKHLIKNRAKDTKPPPAHSSKLLARDTSSVRLRRAPFYLKTTRFMDSHGLSTEATHLEEPAKPKGAAAIPQLDGECTVVLRKSSAGSISPTTTSPTTDPHTGSLPTSYWEPRSCDLAAQLPDAPTSCALTGLVKIVEKLGGTDIRMKKSGVRAIIPVSAATTVCPR